MTKPYQMSTQKPQRDPVKVIGEVAFPGGPSFSSSVEVAFHQKSGDVWLSDGRTSVIGRASREEIIRSLDELRSLVASLPVSETGQLQPQPSKG